MFLFAYPHVCPGTHCCTIFPLFQTQLCSHFNPDQAAYFKSWIFISLVSCLRPSLYRPQRQKFILESLPEVFVYAHRARTAVYQAIFHSYLQRVFWHGHHSIGLECEVAAVGVGKYRKGVVNWTPRQQNPYLTPSMFVLFCNPTFHVHPLWTSLPSVCPSILTLFLYP